MGSKGITYIILVLTFALGEVSFAQYNNSERPEPQKTSTGYVVTETFLYKGKEAKAAVIVNKHGNITVDAWNKDSIKIVYKINVGTYDEDLAGETLDQIKVNKYITGKTLYLKTIYDEDFQSSFSFSVNYHLFVPPALKTKIVSQFGNLYLSGLKEEIKIKADYGKLFIKNDSTTLKAAILHLTFIDGEISKTDTVKFFLNNCKIDLNNIYKTSGITNFTVLNGNSIHNVSLTSNMDRINLNDVGTITVKGEKTFCTVNGLNEKGHFEINTGGLKVSVNNSLNSLTVANTKANTELSIPRGMAYLLHGEVKQGVLIHYDQNALKVLRDVDTVTFSGEFGMNPETNITLFNTGSNLTIKKQ